MAFEVGERWWRNGRASFLLDLKIGVSWSSGGVNRRGVANCVGSVLIGTFGLEVAERSGKSESVGVWRSLKICNSASGWRSVSAQCGKLCWRCRCAHSSWSSAHLAHNDELRLKARRSFGRNRKMAFLAAEWRGGLASRGKLCWSSRCAKFLLSSAQHAHECGRSAKSRRIENQSRLALSGCCSLRSAPR